MIDFLCSSTKGCWFYKRELFKGKIHCCSHRAIGCQDIISWGAKSTFWFSWGWQIYILDDKFDIDFGPSMEIKGPCPKEISEAFVPHESKGKQNLGAMDAYADLFLALVSCATL